MRNTVLVKQTKYRTKFKLTGDETFCYHIIFKMIFCCCFLDVSMHAENPHAGVTKTKISRENIINLGYKLCLNIYYTLPYKC